MKKLFICTILGLFSSSIFAAEAPVNCEELAQYAKKKIEVFEHSSLRGWFYGVDYYRSTIFSKPYLRVSFSVSDACEMKYYQKGCRQAGLEQDPDAVKLLPYRIETYQRYYNALAKCTEDSATPCPMASQMMHELQEKIAAYSQCIALYNEGKIEAIKNFKEKKQKRAAFKQLIREANKKGEPCS